MSWKAAEIGGHEVIICLHDSVNLQAVCSLPGGDEGHRGIIGGIVQWRGDDKETKEPEKRKFWKDHNTQTNNITYTSITRKFEFKCINIESLISTVITNNY